VLSFYAQQAGIIGNPLDIFRLRQSDLRDTSHKSTSMHAPHEGDHKIDSKMDLELDAHNRIETPIASDSPQMSHTKSKSPNLRGRKNWGDRSVGNLLTAIDQKRTISFQRFLYALGIRHIGLETAALLADKFVTFDTFWAYLQSEVDRGMKNRNNITAPTSSDDRSGEHCETADTTNNTLKLDPSICQDILTLKGLGTKAVGALIEFATESRNQAIVAGLMQELDITPMSAQQSTATADSLSTSFPLQGKRVVFTGKLSLMTRSAAQDICKRLGEKIVSFRLLFLTRIDNYSNKQTHASRHVF
jgi:NAD-dependent DNA ligase